MFTHLYNINTCINEMLSIGAVISSPRITLECILQVTTIQVMIAKVILRTSKGRCKSWTHLYVIL